MKLIKSFISESINNNKFINYIDHFLIFVKSLDDYIILCSHYSDDFLLIINTKTSEILEIKDDRFSIGYFSLSEQRMEIACKSDDVLIFDISGNLKDKIEYTCPVETLSYDNSGKYLFIFYEDLTLKTYDLEKKKFINSIKFDFLEYDRYAHYVMNIDDNNKYIIIKIADKISVIKNESIVKYIDLKSSWVEFSNDSKYIASCYYDDSSETISIYDTENWQNLKSFSGAEENYKYVYYDNPYSVCFSPNNKYVVTTYSNAIKIFNFETGEVVYRSSSCGSQNVTFSHDGKYICFNDGKGLKLFEFDFTDYYESEKQKILEKSLVEEAKGEIEYDDLKLELNKTEFFIDEDNQEILKISFKAPANKKYFIAIESIEDKYSQAVDEYLGLDSEIEIYKQDLFNGIGKSEYQEYVWDFKKSDNSLIDDGTYLIILGSDNRQVERTITKEGASMFISEEQAKIAKKGVPRFIFNTSITVEPVRDD